MAQVTRSKQNKKDAVLASKKKLTIIDEINEFTSKYSTLFACIVLLFLVFLTASILTSWTGIIGEKLSEVVLHYLGIPVMIPILFIAYVSLSEIMGRKINNLLSEVGGTFLLFCTSSFFIGLLAMLSKKVGAPFSLSAGIFTERVTLWSTQHLGPLGTTLLSFSLLSSTLAVFGVKLADFTAFARVSSLLWTHRKKKYIEKNFSPEALAHPENLTFASENTLYSSEELPVEEFKEEDPESVPIKLNLSEINSEEDLFAEGDPSSLEGASLAFPPPLEIFGVEKVADNNMDQEKARPWGEKIVSSLNEFGIETELAEILVGPTVIQFRIQLAPGIKVSRVSALSNDLALALAVPSVRVEAPIPGKPYIGIEIPNPKRQGITIRSVLAAMEECEHEVDLPLPMGVTVDGDALIVGLESLPHLLVAGTTGSGKSVFVNSCIVGLCSNRKPTELRMVLVDPKRVEMAAYVKLPHILTPPVTDPKKAVHVLAWALREMQDRYEKFARCGAKNLAGYNAKVLPKDQIPYIVIVVDELADLMMTSPKEVEDYICRLAQMARATGIHLLLATQRPSVNVITGLIKANIPARVAFTLPGSADSRTILDSGGAEKLLGKGDMLFLSTQCPKPVRVQAAWVDERGIDVWLDYLTRLFGEPEYVDIDKQGPLTDTGSEGVDVSDPLFEEAVQIVLHSGMASASGLQRRLRVGFTRAARLIDMMESLGIVGPSEGAKPREILVDEEQAMLLMENGGGA